MGLVAGTLFWQQGDNPNSVIAILFQSMFFSCVGAMVLITKQFPARSIYYKHQDANFFPTWTYVVGRSVASVPTALLDAVGYGTIIYWFVGLAWDDGANISSYFMFMFLILLTALTTGLFFSIFTGVVKVVTIAQSCMSITAILFVLFSGFTVQPDVIPK